eukprot:TRINITY_DN459_c0_g1_i1.p1 TRINITY_DN459_c0_g1~~TRINITY_DN459_c0_g1_i1.p1  ORF type:complete len:502 (+),score=130.37 TRINITY_DN459_c0_g1_i1:47-1552(+)
MSSKKKASYDDDEKESEIEDVEVDEKEESEEQILKALPEKLGELVGAETLADCHFSLTTKEKKKVRIPGHRIVLAANNDIFRAMLYPLTFSTDGKTAEYSPSKIPSDEKDIDIDEVEPEPFKKMLTMLYTDKLDDMTADDLKDLLPLAKRFQVEGLRLKCVEFMEEDVNAENCCALFEQGRKLLNEASFGLKYIEENTAEVAESKGFLSLSKDSILTILKSNNLSIGEVDLFDAVDRWAEAECKRQSLKPTGENKREVLGDAMNYIRFPDMSMAEVCSKVQSAGLLAADELLALFTYLGASKDSKPKCKWNAKPREGGSVFKGSVILNPVQQKTLAAFYSKEKKPKWKLLYHGKENGMDASTFHSKCDSTTPTLVILKSTGTGFIFGGYTEQSWSGSGQYKTDYKAWLFSLVNRPSKPAKFNINQSSYAIYASSGYGPTFGSGYNIYVSSSMTSNNNYCSSSDTYRIEDSSITYSNFYDMFGGSYNWTVDDIEVWTPVTKD